MKKLIFIMLLAFGMIAQAQTFNKETVQLYADTTTITGGDVLIRQVYAFLPTEKPSGNIEFTFQRMYWLNDMLIPFTSETFEGSPTETINISGVNRTYLWVYNQIISINDANWKTGAWQVFLQKVN